MLPQTEIDYNTERKKLIAAAQRLLEREINQGNLATLTKLTTNISKLASELMNKWNKEHTDPST